jgi:hypothetical protein
MGTPPCRNGTVDAEAGGEVRGEQVAHLLVLGEHQRGVAGGQRLVEQRGEARELGAAELRERQRRRVDRGARALAERVGRVVADLFEAREHLQHQALARDAVGAVHLAQGLVDHALVEARLLLGEVHPGGLDDLVGEVVDHAAVALEPPQHQRPHQAAQGGGLLRVALALDRQGQPRPEGAARAEVAGVEELDDRPELVEAVLDRGAGQRQAHLARSCRAARACAVSGFLICCASSSTSACQSIASRAAASLRRSG